MAAKILKYLAQGPRATFKMAPATSTALASYGIGGTIGGAVDVAAGRILVGAVFIAAALLSVALSTVSAAVAIRKDRKYYGINP